VIRSCPRGGKNNGKGREMSEIGRRVALYLIFAIMAIAAVVKIEQVWALIFIGVIALILIVSVVLADVSRLVLRVFSIRSANQTHRRGK